MPEPQFKVQCHVEGCTWQGVAPRGSLPGRAVVHMVSRHFDPDRVRGLLITFQSVFFVDRFLRFGSISVMKVSSARRNQWWFLTCPKVIANANRLSILSCLSTSMFPHAPAFQSLPRTMAKMTLKEQTKELRPKQRDCRSPSKVVRRVQLGPVSHALYNC